MPTEVSAAPEFYGVRILVSDFAKSWRFYRDVLGLAPAKGHGEPPYGEFRWKNRAFVALFDGNLMATAVGLGLPRPSIKQVGNSALIFQVPDVDHLAKVLRSRGARLLRGPTNRPEWRLRTIHLRDPDGYLIEFNSQTG
jgi:lactoylglutathione lyase